jgi:hypothetical protein
MELVRWTRLLGSAISPFKGSLQRNTPPGKIQPPMGSDEFHRRLVRDEQRLT